MHNISVYLVYNGIPLIQEKDRWSVHLPNTYNFSFNFSYYLILHLLAIVLGKPFELIIFTFLCLTYSFSLSLSHSSLLFSYIFLSLSLSLPLLFYLIQSFSLCMFSTCTLTGGLTLMSYMYKRRYRAMKKLAKLQSMKEVYDRQRDLFKIRKKKSKSK